MGKMPPQFAKNAAKKKASAKAAPAAKKGAVKKGKKPAFMDK